MLKGAEGESRRTRNRLERWSHDVATMVHSATRMDRFASISSSEEDLSWAHASCRSTLRSGCSTPIATGTTASGAIRKKSGRVARTRNGNARRISLTSSGRLDSIGPQTLSLHAEQVLVTYVSPAHTAAVQFVHSAEMSMYALL